MSTGNALLALTLGIGGGLALAYLRRDDEVPAPAGPAPIGSGRSPVGLPAAEVPGSEPPAVRACSLRLDGKGLIADGMPVDIATAVKRCKAAGLAELFFAQDGPAAVYVELGRALLRAGIPVNVRGP